MTRVVRIHEQGEPEVMRFEDLRVTRTGAGRSTAAGALPSASTASEAMFRKGAYPVQASVSHPHRL